jgi:hypothetical protein
MWKQMPRWFIFVYILLNACLTAAKATSRQTERFFAKYPTPVKDMNGADFEAFVSRQNIYVHSNFRFILPWLILFGHSQFRWFSFIRLLVDIAKR